FALSFLANERSFSILLFIISKVIDWEALAASKYTRSTALRQSSRVLSSLLFSHMSVKNRPL
ncbi:MAG: hypothetical protein WCS07_11455, partial [Sphaerochaeta sp.]